jgi:hypothetical protein
MGGRGFCAIVNWQMQIQQHHKMYFIFIFNPQIIVFNGTGVSKIKETLWLQCVYSFLCGSI